MLANVAAIRIEHARLIEVEQAKRILAKDLDQAALIQQGFCRRRLRKFLALSWLGTTQRAERSAETTTISCRILMDGWRLPWGRVGKAMPAALLMTSLQARVRVLAEEPPEVAGMMTRLNRATAANCPSNRFISFFFSVLDPKTGELTYANAGHNPPMIARQAERWTGLRAGDC